MGSRSSDGMVMQQTNKTISTEEMPGLRLIQKQLDLAHRPRQPDNHNRTHTFALAANNRIFGMSEVENLQLNRDIETTTGFENSSAGAHGGL